MFFNWKILSTFTFGLLGLFAVLKGFPLKEWTIILETYLKLNPLTGVGIYCLVFCILSLLVIPTTPLCIMAGVVWDFKLGSGVLTLASALSLTINFYLARRFFGSSIQKGFGHHPLFKLVTRALAESPSKVAFWMRLSPLFPVNIIHYIFSLTPIRFWPHFWGSNLGLLPGNILIVWASAQSALAMKTAGNPAIPWVGSFGFQVGLALAATVVLSFQATRFFYEFQDPPEEAMPDFLSEPVEEVFSPVVP